MAANKNLQQNNLDRFLAPSLNRSTDRLPIPWRIAFMVSL